MLGVPGDCIRVELAGNPPHVALRDGDVWLSPMDESYADVFQRYRGGLAAAWAYIAGGSVGESVFAATLIVGFTFTGADEVAVVLAWATAALFVAYLTADLVASLIRKAVSGDWSAMYAVQPVATIALALFLGVVKITALAWLTS